MRGNASSMTLLRPSSSKQALRFYAEAPHALPLAGGTDLMVAWNAGLLNNKTVLDLSRLHEWKNIRVGKESIEIGALVSHTQIQTHPAICRHFALLAKACAVIGGWQIQNRGTIGGNIANASPAGDTFPALAVYEARVKIVSSQGARLIPFLDIFAGVKKTTLRPSELVVGVEIPFLKNHPRASFFRKVGARQAQAISKVVAAGLLWLNKDGSVKCLSFALGSMAPTIRRLKTVEDFCVGKKMTADVLRQACKLLEQDVSPIDDIRSTRLYRLQVSKNLLRSFLEGR